MTCKNQHPVRFTAASSADLMQLWESETNSFSELSINKNKTVKDTVTLETDQSLKIVKNHFCT